MKKASLLIQEIQTHKYNSIFKDVYVDEHLLRKIYFIVW